MRSGHRRSASSRPFRWGRDRRGVTPRSLGEHGHRCGLHHRDQRIGKQAEKHHDQGADDDRHANRLLGPPAEPQLADRFAEEHRLEHPNIVKRRNDRVQQPQRHQPHQGQPGLAALLIRGFHEHIKLTKKAGERGNADQREHEDEDADRQERRLVTQAVQVVDVVGLLVADQPGGHREGPDIGNA